MRMHPGCLGTRTSLCAPPFRLVRRPSPLNRLRLPPHHRIHHTASPLIAHRSLNTCAGQCGSEFSTRPCRSTSERSSSYPRWTPLPSIDARRPPVAGGKIARSPLRGAISAPRRHAAWHARMHAGRPEPLRAARAAACACSMHRTRRPVRWRGAATRVDAGSLLSLYACVSACRGCPRAIARVCGGDAGGPWRRIWRVPRGWPSHVDCGRGWESSGPWPGLHGTLQEVIWLVLNRGI